MSEKPDYDFITDGCSGGMTWCWRKIYRRNPPWEAKCVEHDMIYWRGGSKGMRYYADYKLWNGIKDNYPIFAFLIWCAIRVGGYPLLPLPWRWGYGWKWPRRYVSGTKVD